MNDNTKAESSCINAPNTPNGLITLALLCVPLMYTILLLSTALVITIGGGLIWLLIKFIPINITLIVISIGLGFGVIFGIIAVIKGVADIILPESKFEPAIILNRANESKLRQFLIQLCMKLDTDLPDCILLHAEPTFFVTQGKIATFNGIAKGRILAIGLPCIAGLTVNELRSLLSHEFAHFTGKDIAYSAKVLPIYKGVVTAGSSMEESIIDTKINSNSHIMAYSTIIPMLLPKFVLIAYFHIFHALDMKIHKIRELRADAIAVNTCGSKCFEKALIKVYAIDALFNDQAVGETIKQIAAEQNIDNHFSAFRIVLPKLAAKASIYAKEAYETPENKTDTHPSLKNRIKDIGCVPEQYDDKDMAATLFTDLESYEKTLSGDMDKLMRLIQIKN